MAAVERVLLRSRRALEFSGSLLKSAYHQTWRVLPESQPSCACHHPLRLCKARASNRHRGVPLRRCLGHAIIASREISRAALASPYVCARLEIRRVASYHQLI